MRLAPSLEIGEAHGFAPGTPGSRGTSKDTRELRAALSTGTGFVKAPVCQHVPVAANDALAAASAGGAAAGLIVDIAGVDMVQADALGDSGGS
jgi:hypothetical protein